MAQENDLSRRDLLKAAGAATAVAATVQAAAPAIQKVRAANDQVQYGMIGTGSRGSYLLKHLKNIDSGRCVALCDINAENLKHGVETIGNNPKTFKDYRELLALQDVDAVFVITPLFVHYPLTTDALKAGKNVFCEKCLVFKPEEVHALRALYAEHPKQILQTGLQRRYSYFYQTVKKMVDKGILGDVHHIHAQWHRNMVNKPSSLWTMKPGGESNIANWRVYRSMSGGLTAELTSHQVDVADWMFGSPPEFVMGLGSLDTLQGRPRRLRQHPAHLQVPQGPEDDVFVNQHEPVPAVFQRESAGDGRDHHGYGRHGRDHCRRRRTITAIAWWYREPPKVVSTGKADEKKAVRGGRHNGGYRRSERTDPDHDHRPAVLGQGRVLRPRSEIRPPLADVQGRAGCRKSSATRWMSSWKRSSRTAATGSGRWRTSKSA